LNTPPDLGNVERRLVATFRGKAVDKRGDALLRRECGDVLGELSSAYHPAEGEPEPDWEHVAHAVAFIALRKAWIATHAAFKNDAAFAAAEEEA
jgi:hypothetical protein